MNEAMLPAPLARDVAQWSSCPRMWRLQTARTGEVLHVISCEARLEDLETHAAQRPCDFSGPIELTFFCLPVALTREARALDPASLFRREANNQSHRFLAHFGEYLEFLGLVPDARARACIVAPAAVSCEIVPPFDDPRTAGADTIVCCNLSEVNARIALRNQAAVGNGENGDASVALSLGMGECLVGLRQSILGYIPDQQGDPTLWFECLLRDKRARSQ